MDNPNPLFLTVSDNKTLGFIPTITNLLNLSTDQEKLDVVKNLLPEHFTNIGLNLTKQCIDEYRGSEIGFYSFLYNRMYGDLDHIVMGKMESLRHDFKHFLTKIDAHLSPEMLHHLEVKPRLNYTVHGVNPDYYDDSLRMLVERKDAVLIERHDYNFNN